MLQATGLRKSFGGVHAVDGCDLRLEAGRMTGLIGPNGAGKSTLFNLLTGFIHPDAGKIYFKGKCITHQCPQKRFRQGLVRSFQIPQEFTHLTVIENLMVVPARQIGESLPLAWLRPRRVARQEAELREKAEDVLDFLDLMPLRDEAAGTLSGGQRKLLELGRTIMADAELILLDEPGAGVNRTLLKTLCEKIEILNAERGLTFCIIEHDMDVIARLCDPIIVMAQGRILAQGDFASIRNNPEIQEAYLGVTVEEDAPQNGETAHA